MPSTAGLVLAAGEGRRFGGPKALAEVEGERLVDRVVRVLRIGGCDPVVVVLGAAVVEVPPADRVVVNDGWREGMGSSLRVGLAALEGYPVDAACVVLVDQPGLLPAGVRRVVAHGAADALVVATYGGERAHPVVLGREHWAGVVAAAVGDRGARDYLAAHGDTLIRVPCDGAGDPDDVDTPEELAERGSFLTRLSGGAGSAGGALGAGLADFGALFLGAGARAAEEERAARSIRRETDAEGAPPFEVDLESGVVRIRRRSGPDAAG